MSDEPTFTNAVPPQRQVVAWIIQGNPNLYDIDTYFSRQTFIYWNCPLYADQMQIGMPVFFKRSGPGGGLIAFGTIAELPKPSREVERPASLGFDLWQQTPEDDPLKVGVELNEVRRNADDGMIDTQSLERIPELAGHPLVTVRQGTI